MPAGDSDRLDVIRGMTSALISSIGSDELFQAIVDKAKEISGAKYVSLSFFNEARGTTKLAALSGADSGLVGKIANLLGMKKLLQQELPVSKSANFKKFLRKRQRKPIILKDFHEYTFGLFSKRACALIEKIAGIKEIVVIPLLRDKQFEGILGYLYHTKEKRDFAPLLIFSDFALQAIDKSKVFTQLQEAKGDFLTIFETAGTAMAIIEEDTTISMANKGLEELLCYPKNEIMGKSCMEFVRKEDLKMMKEYHTLRRKDPHTAPNSFELRFFDRSGNAKVTLLNVSIIPGTKRSVVSLLDITENKQIGEERMWKGLVEMWSETLTGEIIRAFEVRVSSGELCLPEVLEHMANLNTVPSPHILFNMMIRGMRRILVEKGVDTSVEQIRKILSPTMSRFLRGVFAASREFHKDVPTTYKEFEKELSQKVGYGKPRPRSNIHVRLLASIVS